jgi:hypothetical protein
MKRGPCKNDGGTGTGTVKNVIKLKYCLFKGLAKTEMPHTNCAIKK